MAIDFTEIQKAAKAKFTDFEVIVPAEEGEGTETLTFRHILRVPKEVRAAYGKAADPKTYVKDKAVKDMDLQDGLCHLVKESFRVVAKTPHDFDRLEAVIRETNEEAPGEDSISEWQELFAEYNAETEAGEA